jgi:hypothetical protein
MYSIGVFYSQIYVSILSGRQSSLYSSHFLIRQVYTPSRPLGITEQSQVTSWKVTQSGRLLQDVLMKYFTLSFMETR